MNFCDAPCLLDGKVRDAITLVGENIHQRRQGRHQVGARLQHLTDAFIGHEYPMFNGINAAPDGVENAGIALGMAGSAFMETLGFTDPGEHFLGAVMGILRIHPRVSLHHRWP